MCHHVHVKLTAPETKAVRKMYGIMVPVFASIVLLLLAAITLTQPPRAGDVLMAEATSAPVTAGR